MASMNSALPCVPGVAYTKLRKTQMHASFLLRHVNTPWLAPMTRAATVFHGKITISTASKTLQSSFGLQSAQSSTWDLAYRVGSLNAA